jgi:hypothetical protein
MKLAYCKSLATGIIIISTIGLINYSCKKIENFGGDSRYGLRLLSSNVGNKWNYKFYYLQGKVQGYFTAKSDNAQLVYSSEIEKGTVTFELYNASDSLLRTFPANDNTGTINGFVKGEKYRVKAIADAAKGHFDMEMK